MSLLSVIQEVCRRINIPQPASVIGNADANITQLLGIANEEGQKLARRHRWTALNVEATFQTLAAQQQVNVKTTWPDFRYIVNDTLWNRDLKRPVFGPLVPAQWQQLAAQSMQGPWQQYRIRQGYFYFIPQPPAGQNIWFEYASAYWLNNAVGGYSSNAFRGDTDVVLLDEEIIQMGIEWRWKKKKGLEYAEDFTDYERMVLNAMAQDGGKAVLNLSGSRFDIYPSIAVPSGSWPITGEPSS